MRVLSVLLLLLASLALASLVIAFEAETDAASYELSDQHIEFVDDLQAFVESESVVESDATPKKTAAAAKPVAAAAKPAAKPKSKTAKPLLDAPEDLSEAGMRAKFEEYKLERRKVYKRPSDEARAYTLFKRNRFKVYDLNKKAGKKIFTSKGKFADVDDADFMAQRLGVVLPKVLPKPTPKRVKAVAKNTAATAAKKTAAPKKRAATTKRALVETEVNVDVQADADAEAETEADADAEAGADVEAETEAESESEVKFDWDCKLRYNGVCTGRWDCNDEWVDPGQDREDLCPNTSAQPGCCRKPGAKGPEWDLNVRTNCYKQLGGKCQMQHLDCQYGGILSGAIINTRETSAQRLCDGKGFGDGYVCCRPLNKPAPTPAPQPAPQPTPQPAPQPAPQPTPQPPRPAPQPTPQPTPAPVQKGLVYEVDYRNIITPVKDQGPCGSCWAHAATENFESSIAKAGKKPPILSPQAIMDCRPWDWRHSLTSCKGDWSTNAFDFWEANPAVLLSEYPYAQPQKAEQNCTAKKGSGPTIKEWSYAIPACQSLSCTLNRDEAAMLAALKKYGPLVVAIDASTFKDYKSGVLPGKLCSSDPSKLNHAVEVVGYGVEDGTKFWLVRNSWGDDWADKGFLRMEYGVNACGIANVVTYIIPNV